ncbi:MULTISPECIES: Gfo/Idh/MocA family protein [unclassified Pseudomonas]|uniref:Gfo/Idh/MocA family protein n=1 Tax=unclassified Pseudomonas TaxID=196821 RepID=UPI000CD17CDA|nr:MULTISPECIES: Gfo/Idh/MocA family oxidoreductase [unclassified Pseudomonas]POA29763.1 gfo/Idh/MocA family oxidoreductase [Pseudomonas sp. GW456-R21]POA69120.1 gfo/Idh/MocA family oxidoreductase [Pseudomonas sp. GW460-R15]
MSSPLRIALIGAGNMGQQHYQHLKTLNEATLCAVADPGPQAVGIAAEWGVPYFTDHRALLEQLKPDAVIVANPNNLHVSTALDCLAAGVPVLLEKPVGVHLDEVRTLVAASTATGVPVLVGHHRRHNPLIARAHELVRSGALGQLTMVTALWQVRKPDSYFETPWRREAGAGMLLTNLIHDLDLLRHLCGEVHQVQAITSNAVRRFANEDCAAVLLQFDNGALGSLTGSDAVAAPWSWELDSGENPVYPRQADQPCYLLAGTAGALSIPQLKRWHYAEADAGWHQPLQTVQEGFNADEALRLQLQHFVKVARGEAKPLVSVADAARTLALIDAIREAAASGRACVPARIEE